MLKRLVRRRRTRQTKSDICSLVASFYPTLSSVLLFGAKNRQAIFSYQQLKYFGSCAVVKTSLCRTKPRANVGLSLIVHRSMASRDYLQCVSIASSEEATLPQLSGRLYTLPTHTLYQLSTLRTLYTIPLVYKKNTLSRIQAREGIVVVYSSPCEEMMSIYFVTVNVRVSVPVGV